MTKSGDGQVVHHRGNRSLAEPNVILEGIVGSTVHGLAVEDQDDEDRMGICVEPFAHYFGLRDRFEHWGYRTQPEGKRSGPGDVDRIVYSLAKWARMALNGNPSVLLLLFIPVTKITESTHAGMRLREMANAFLGNNLFTTYRGYMRQQRDRLTRKRKMPIRPELIARYGFDTKYAGHIIRLGYQGIELTTTGRLDLPMREPERTRILNIRTGKVPQPEVMEEAIELEAELSRLEQTLDLGEPDRGRVEQFVIDCYLERGAQ